jgi:microcystin degradation protein MlrC
MTKRVALIGYALEVNGFAPVTTKAHFDALFNLEGAALLAEMRKEGGRLSAELPGFATRLGELADWTPVPIAAMAATPGGPVDSDFYEAWMAGVKQRMEAEGPFDGVYLANHGAGAATRDLDSDGTLYEIIREAVGPEVPFVVSTDLHANVSDRMVAMPDVLITYRTNPHVDQRERGAEAAEIMSALWQGMKPQKAFIRLPLCPPSVTLLTREGPFADLVRMGQAEADQEILNVSLFGNFSFGDLPDCGLAVMVTAKTDLGAARRLCLKLAKHAWDDRHRHVPNLTALEDAVAMATARGADAGMPAAIYADAADNPGGGGSGRTVALLKGLHEAGARGVIMGVFHDPTLAAEAHEKGVGASFRAVFNRDYDGAFVEPFTAEAEVIALHDGDIVGRRGTRQGRLMPHGPSALLKMGGVQAVVSSKRLQCLDPAQFESFGLDVEAARTVVVKSRGHFRAGFDGIFPPERTYEIDTPGLTSPVLTRFDFKHLPRPVFPLDEDASWTPPHW